MKTKYFSAKNTFLKSIIGLLGLAVASCGTYQNKSYYDNDGIYGAEKQETNVQNNEQSSPSSNNKYKEYFGSNADKYSNDQSEVFTDVENYSSENNTAQNEGSDSNYGSWGTNSDNITINVYDNGWGNYGYGYWNNYWGYSPWHTGIYIGWNSWNYGWCNPYWGYSGYYGPSWGWHYPYYGGYYNGYYGYNNWNNGYYNGYAYSPGRRGSSAYGNRNYSGSNGVRNYSPGRRNNYTAAPRTNTSGFDNPRSSYQTPPRRGNTRTEANSNSNSNYNYDQISTPRPRTSPRNNEINNTPRPRISSPRSESSTPRNYSSPPRSSSSYPSGGHSSGGGGGRSGGRRG